MTENLDRQYLAQLMAGLYLGDGLPLLVDSQPAICEPLPSILSQVGKQGQTIAPSYFKPKRMDTAAESVFATPTRYTTAEVAEALKDANAEISNLQLHPAALKYSLFYWTYAHGARIAKSGEPQGVSAFDSNRIQAAQWVCDQHLPDQKNYLLLKGDIAGIQKFIYYDADKNLEEPGRSKELSKRLRGRSFYVALLTDFLAEEIVRRTALEQANIIYSGGGNFLILLPNTEAVKQTLDELEQFANLSLLKQVGRGLGVYFGYAERDESMLTDFGATVFEVNRSIEQKKNRQHQRYLASVMTEEVHTPKFKPDGGKWSSFKDDEMLGEKVPYAHFLVEVRFKTPLNANLLHQAQPKKVTSLQDFNTYYFLAGETRQRKSAQLDQERGRAIASIKGLLTKLVADGAAIELVTIHLLNDTDFLQWHLDLLGFNFPIRYGFKFIGNEAPRYDDDDLTDFGYATSEQQPTTGILTFEDLAALPQPSSAEPLGYQQLAVMRLDVDDLGALFAYGLANTQNQVSLKEVSSLSREIHLFFSGYFNRIAAAHRIYITYSGGDDAFVVGSWQNVVHFAAALKQDFDRFVCQNQNIHFSAGIYFCNPHFPVAKFAHEAAELEEKSKKYFKGDSSSKLADLKGKFSNLPLDAARHKLADKNAIHVFNKTVHWDKFGEMLQFALALDQFVERGKSEKKGNNLSHAVVQRLLAIIKSSRQAVEAKDDMIFYTNVARLRYLLARNNFGEKALQNAQKNELQALISQLLHHFGAKETFDDYLIPMHYVLYSNRKQK